MPYLMVSYDLHYEEEIDYDLLHKALQTYHEWCWPLESTWIIETDQTPRQVLAHLRSYVHDRDSILVMEVGPRAAWRRLKKDNGDWLKARFTVT
jgi:hypothetical protein